MKRIIALMTFLLCFNLKANQHLSCFEQLTKMLAHKYYFNTKAKGISDLSFKGIKSFDELEQTYGGYAFFDLQYFLSPNAIQENNRIVSQLTQSNPSKKGTSIKKVEEIYHQMLSRNSVRKEPYYESLINQNCLETGFCFGRATIAHMEAIIKEIPAEYIKKIWVVGEMKEWTFHVATMIFANGKWMVLDNKLGLYSAKRWMREIRKRLVHGKQMFFVTQPTRFGVNSPKQYSYLDLFGNSNGQDYYQGYFREYFDEISQFEIKSNL